MLALALPAWADKVAVMPFTSTNNVPRTELEEARKWTRDAVTKRGHTYATANEMVSAEAAVRDGVADTSQEDLAAGNAADAQWTLAGRVERNDHPSATLPDGREEEGYTTYRVELEACQVQTGRVESLSREVLPDEGPNDIADMLTLLLRPEGISNAPIPWEKAAPRRPKPRIKPVSAPPPPPPAPDAGPKIPAVRYVYGEGHPFSIGASIGVNTALVRPDVGRGPSAAMPIGGVIGYALPEALAGLELKGNLTSQVLGPQALEISAGARYAVAPLAGVRLFVGPELLVGAHVAMGAEKTARFLTHGSAFVAFGLVENFQVEVAGDLAGAFGGSGTLVLGGGTLRAVLRF
jgi:hypothetical protein